jgi:two-component system CheB/CheR fusion protein
MASEGSTEQKSSEEPLFSSYEIEALQDALRRYELIFQATHDVLYDLDLETGKVSWNDALYTQYGYSHREPAGTLEWWTGHVHPDDALQLEHKATELFESVSHSWSSEYRFRRADGGYNYVRDRGLLVRDREGEPTRIIGSLLDITPQKQLDIAKDEFVSLVSHQLRTPLTVIRVYGEMLTGGMFGDLTPEQTQWIKNMTNSSARLIDIVGDILNVSRLDLGRIRISARQHDLSKLIDSCVQDVQPLADERQVTLALQLPKRPVLADVDDVVFAQIVHNLLTNAIRYTRPGKGQVDVDLKSRKNGYVLSVSDNGIGIPKSAQPHVFERFYRAKNALAVDVQGSGLGLYLIKVMCDAFGGKVWFETEKGKGTVFHILIPRAGMRL